MVSCLQVKDLQATGMYGVGGWHLWQATLCHCTFPTADVVLSMNCIVKVV